MEKEGQTVTIADTTSETADIGDNITAAIEKAMESEAPATSPETKVEETPAVEVKDSSVETQFTPDDALVERAVKAGLSLADAKSFGSKDAMERILGIVESAKQPKEPTDVHGEESPAEEEIPTLPEDEDYDEKLVKAFNGMGALLKAARAEIANLRKAGASATQQSFFDSEFGKLDEGVRAHVDAATKSRLKAKFDMLKGGYAAVKANISDSDVFDEAKALVLGDIISRASKETKEAALAKRQGLRLSQPGGIPERTGERQDAESSVVDALFSALTK